MVKIRRKCHYCKKKIKKSEESKIVWQKTYGFDMYLSYYYKKRRIHPWCAKIGIEEKKYLEENPDHVKRREFLKKVEEVKKELRKDYKKGD